MNNIIFTHFWVSCFGWENTIYLPEDFKVVEILWRNEKDGIIFNCMDERGVQHIIKGKYN